MIPRRWVHRNRRVSLRSHDRVSSDFQMRSAIDSWDQARTFGADSAQPDFSGHVRTVDSLVISWDQSPDSLAGCSGRRIVDIFGCWKLLPNPAKLSHSRLYIDILHGKCGKALNIRKEQPFWQTRAAGRREKTLSFGSSKPVHANAAHRRGGFVIVFHTATGPASGRHCNFPLNP